MIGTSDRKTFFNLHCPPSSHPCDNPGYPVTLGITTYPCQTSLHWVPVPAGRYRVPSAAVPGGCAKLIAHHPTSRHIFFGLPPVLGDSPEAFGRYFILWRCCCLLFSLPHILFGFRIVTTFQVYTRSASSCRHSVCLFSSLVLPDLMVTPSRNLNIRPSWLLPTV